MIYGAIGARRIPGRQFAEGQSAAEAAAAARHQIAVLALADELTDGMTLGEVTLLPHQVHAVHRLTAVIQSLGGALLADETGLGKTYVALTLASRVRHPLVIAPAALAPMWAEALRRTGVRASFRTTEGLSRADRPELREARYDLVVVDEAQHFRNPRTRRYDRLARLLNGSPVLLLSATPVHNSGDDLRHLLALFTGARAWTLDAATLARCIVRRDAAALIESSRPPTVAPLVWLFGGDDPAQNGLLDSIVELPPPLPPRDGGDAGALLAHGLVRQWSSSIGALHGALRRRLVRAEALLAALDSGHHLSAGELRQWAIGDDAVQLPLPGLFDVVAAAAPSLREALVAHRDAVRALLRQSSRCDDSARADALRQIRNRHAGAHVVAFSQYADTVDALYRLLARDGGICALHGAGARVAGGALTRDDALRRFAPLAHGVAPPSRAERITMLIATDVLSEGINLQDASVVVHLDLPWTAARLEQRVGRVARLGSAHTSVAVYALAPPARSERLLGVERRLRRKWRDAGRAVGVRGAILPALASPTVSSSGEASTGGGVVSPTAPPAHQVALHARLRRWRDDVRLLANAGLTDVAVEDGRLAPVAGSDEALHRLISTGSHSGNGAPADGASLIGDTASNDAADLGALIGAFQAPPGLRYSAFFAAVEVDGRTRLLAGRADRGSASDDPGLMAELAEAVDHAGPAVRPDDATVSWAHEAVASWYRGQVTGEALAILAPGAVALQRGLLGRLARIVRSTPLHQRPAILGLAATARRALTRPLGAGGERVLAELVSAPMADACWLRTLAAFAESDGRRLMAEACPNKSLGGAPATESADTAAQAVPAAVMAALLILIPDVR